MTETCFMINHAEIIRSDVKKFLSESNLHACLAIVSVGHDPASEVYVRNKIRACEEVGMEVRHFSFSENTNQADLISFVDQLGKDNSVNGIIVQLPLPKQFDESFVLKMIPPIKDVDGFSDANGFGVYANDERITPCTPQGVIELMQRGLDGDETLEGKHVVILGRSLTVGRPLAAMCLNRNMTVSVLHSKSNPDDRKALVQKADFVVVAMGKPEAFNAEFVGDPSTLRHNATIIDVGIHRKEDKKLCGDVKADDFFGHVKYITRVPGGVGPMTVACLIRNTAMATLAQHG